MTVELNRGPDPDPTPTTTPWQEYLAAAQSLDAVVREAAAEAATNARTAREDLARLRAALDRQRAQLLAAAAAAGAPGPPPLLPGPAERAAAEERVSADPATVAQALRHCERLIAAGDAQLRDGPLPVVSTSSGLPGPPGQPVPLGQPVPPGLSGSGAPPRRTWWPLPVWLLFAVPLGGATLLLCVVSLVLAVTG